jgi:hypothetical protein
LYLRIPVHKTRDSSYRNLGCDMDISDEESCLIHSKFRKAKRQFASRLTEQQVISATDVKPLEEPTTAYTSVASSIALAFEVEEQMHVECPIPSNSEVATHVSNSRNNISSSHVDVFGSSGPGAVEGASKSPTLFGTNLPVIIGTGGGGAAVSPSRVAPLLSHMSVGSSSTFPCEVFRFDSTDRERYLCSAISEEEEVFSPGPSPSALSTRSYDSNHIFLDSPRITISPLRIQDSPPLTTLTANTPSPIMDSQNRLMARVHPGLAMLPPPVSVEQGRLFGIPSSPVSPLTPNTPLSPSPLFSSDHSTFQQGFLAELYRRR